MPKQMKLDCPECGAHITVRIAAKDEPQEGFRVGPSPENRKKIADAVQEMSGALSTGMKKVFDPKLWK